MRGLAGSGTVMTSEELEQCLQEAFGDLEPPYMDEVSLSWDMDGFEDAVRTETGPTKRWQDLRPLPRNTGLGLAIFILTPRAWQYYLPAYLCATTDPEVAWCYVGSILGTLWYE